MNCGVFFFLQWCKLDGHILDFLHVIKSCMKHMDVSKNRGKTPKMDGENNGKPYSNRMIWGYHYSWKHPYL